jgi:hypothetical protein
VLATWLAGDLGVPGLRWSGRQWPQISWFTLENAFSELVRERRPVRLDFTLHLTPADCNCQFVQEQSGTLLGFTYGTTTTLFWLFLRRAQD